MTAGQSLPRVLVVSHNPFSEVQNNGKTLSAFFEDWPRDRLAQLYLTLDEPSFSKCDTFYRVTDLDVLKDALPGFRGAAGPVREHDWSTDQSRKASLGSKPWYRAVRSLFLARHPAALVARSMIWKVGRRDGEKFRTWLDQFDPELVFFQSSSADFAFDLVETICRERSIPLIMETTDDYLTPGPRWAPLSRTYYRRMQAAYSRAVEHAHAVVAIGDSMAREYSARFGGRWEVAMNSVEEDRTPPPPDLGDSELVLHFAGNLGLNRWRVLESIGRALDILAVEHDYQARLEIFSIDTPEQAVLEQLTSGPRVRFRGATDSESLRRHRSEARILVHVESFDAQNRHITRLSISTKLPEYMAANRVILAVGPEEVASMRYVEDEGFGIAISSEDPRVIADRLAEELASPDRQRELRTRAVELARARHSRAGARELVTRLALEAVSGRPMKP